MATKRKKTYLSKHGVDVSRPCSLCGGPTFVTGKTRTCLDCYHESSTMTKKRAKSAKRSKAKKNPKRWIQSALGIRPRRVKKGGKKVVRVVAKKPGALHRQLHVPKGKKIPLALERRAAKAPGTLGRRARLALTLRNLGEKRSKKKM